MGIQGIYMKDLFDAAFAKGPTLSIPQAELKLSRFRGSEGDEFSLAPSLPTFNAIISGNLIIKDGLRKNAKHGPSGFILIPPGQQIVLGLSSETKINPVRTLSVSVTQDLIESVAEKMSLGSSKIPILRMFFSKICSGECHPFLRDSVCGLMNLFISKSPDKGFLADHKLQEIIYFLIRNNYLYDEVNIVPGYEYSKPTIRAIKFMIRNLSNRISMDSLSRFCSLSPSRLSMVFKKEMGCPPMAYLNRLRIEYAQQLLKIPGISVTEISFEISYESVAHFIHQFRKSVGITPNQYRRIMELKRSNHFDSRSLNLVNNNVLARRVSNNQFSQELPSFDGIPDTALLHPNQPPPIEVAA